MFNEPIKIETIDGVTTFDEEQLFSTSKEVIPFGFKLGNYIITHYLKLPSKVTDYDYHPFDKSKRYISTFIHEFVIQDLITKQELFTFSMCSEDYANFISKFYIIITEAASNNSIRDHYVTRNVTVPNNMKKCIIESYYDEKSRCIMNNILLQGPTPGKPIFTLIIPLRTKLDEDALETLITQLDYIIENTEDNIMSSYCDNGFADFL